jgi:hypothetical protein
VLSVADIKRVVSDMKDRSAGTVYIAGERWYIWKPGKGWVIKPGPLKAKARKRRG